MEKTFEQKEFRINCEIAGKSGRYCNGLAFLISTGAIVTNIPNIAKLIVENPEPKYMIPIIITGAVIVGVSGAAYLANFVRNNMASNALIRYSLKDTKIQQ